MNVMNGRNEKWVKRHQPMQADMNWMSVNEWKNEARKEATAIKSIQFIHEVEWKIDWFRADWRERAALHFNSTNSLNSLRLMWIEVKLNERRQWVKGFIPFHEVHSAFINYMKWINLAKLNGMRMNDIITVMEYEPKAIWKIILNETIR